MRHVRSVVAAAMLAAALPACSAPVLWQDYWPTSADGSFDTYPGHSGPVVPRVCSFSRERTGAPKAPSNPRGYWDGLSRGRPDRT